MTLRPGLLVTALFFCLYGAFALAVNLPKATYAFKSDEATYYMMGLSLVHDHDLTYRREDLVRVWKEFPAGPAGVFLKRGKKLDGSPDPARGRYYYGKSFIYPLFAAPFIALFGTNGFLLLNVICLSVVLLCAYLFLHARAPAWPSAILAAGFVMASIMPVYLVQMMPEVFNFSLACTAYFCWLYKEVASPERSPKGTAWLFTPRSDLVCALLLGIATFSKPTIALLFVAPLAFRLKAETTKSTSVVSGFSGKILIRKVLASAAFAAVAGGLFAVNTAISGEWNYQAGDRQSYTYEFPFQTEGSTTLQGADKSRQDFMAQHIVFNPRTFTSNLLHNLEYFFAGRYAGMLPYCFPGLFAMAAFLVRPAFAKATAGKRPLWQWLVLLSALAQGLAFVVATPYTWSGGGVGNRYFVTGYAVMIFLLPPIESIAAAFVPWTIGALFVAPSVLNPFAVSFQPSQIAKAGPLRMLPVELTLLNDLPVFTEGETRSRVEFGGVTGTDPKFLVSFLDDNVHGREEDRSFWTRGDSRADLVFKVGVPLKSIRFSLAAGPVPADVTIAVDGRSTRVHLAPGETADTMVPAPGGLPYEKEVEGARLYNVRIYTTGGFTPLFFDQKSNDARYLGVRVKPMLEPNQ